MFLYISAHVGVDFKLKLMSLKGKKLKLTIWDTGMYHFISVISFLVSILYLMLCFALMAMFLCFHPAINSKLIVLLVSPFGLKDTNRNKYTFSSLHDMTVKIDCLQLCT